MVIFESWFLLLLALVAACVVGIRLYARHIYTYWERRNIKFIQPSFPFGNLSDAVYKGKAFIEVFKSLYYSTDEKVIGIYTANQPALMIRDPHILRMIFVKDFNYFTDHGAYTNEDTDPLSAHLFAIGGDKWRNLRAKLSPTFSSGKLKGMFKTLVDCGRNIETFVNQHIDEDIEIRDLMSSYSINVVSSVAFGVDTDTIMNPNAIFKRMGKKFFEPTLRTTLRYACFLVLPHVGKLLGIRSVVKEYEDLVFKLVTDTTNYREKHNIQRRDFMQLLLQLKNTGKVEDDDVWTTGIQGSSTPAVAGETLTTFSFNELVAQTHLFFLAGFETAATTITFCIYELAKRPDLQAKAQQEIDEVLKQHNGELTYEGINEMKFVDCCIMEALRMYTPVIILNRQCVQDYRIPELGITIEKGTRLIIPAHAIHSDPKHYPNPGVFTPERFMNVALNNEENGVTFMAFGEGPRNCIGLRLGKIETKIAVALILAKFNLRLGKRLEGVENVQHERRSYTPQILGGTFVKFSRRT